MLEYKLTPEQRILNAIENETPALPPSCSLDRYNKEDLRQILSDWILIYNETSSNFSQKVFDKCYSDKITNKELMQLIKSVNHKASLIGNIRQVWKKVLNE